MESQYHHGSNNLQFGYKPPDVNNVGNYVGDFVRFIATPPVGGSFTMTAQTDAGGIGGYSTPKNSTQTWTYRSGSQQNYTSGQLWINITTTDAYGRTAVDVYTFTIDDEVTSTPTLATTGTQTIINGSTYLGANGRITLANLIDAGGVGVDSAECFWNANTQANTYSATASLTPPSNAVPNHTIHAQLSNRGQVGNIGNNTTIFGFVDLQTPTTTILPMAGNTITANSIHQLCNHG